MFEHLHTLEHLKYTHSRVYPDRSHTNNRATHAGKGRKRHIKDKPPPPLRKPTTPATVSGVHAVRCAWPRTGLVFLVVVVVVVVVVDLETTTVPGQLTRFTLQPSSEILTPTGETAGRLVSSVRWYARGRKIGSPPVPRRPSSASRRCSNDEAQVLSGVAGADQPRPTFARLLLLRLAMPAILT